jgi:hypothetical protein
MDDADAVRSQSAAPAMRVRRITGARAAAKAAIFEATAHNFSAIKL